MRRCFAAGAVVALLVTGGAAHADPMVLRGRVQYDERSAGGARVIVTPAPRAPTRSTWPEVDAALAINERWLATAPRAVQARLRPLLRRYEAACTARDVVRCKAAAEAYGRAMVTWRTVPGGDRGRAPRSAPTAPAATDAGALLDAVNGWWAGRFHAQGHPYLPPRVIATTYVGATEYDPSTSTIRYNPAYLAGLTRELGPFAANVALLHELAHHVQYLSGAYARFDTPQARELDADWLMGASVRFLQGQGLATSDDVASAALAVYLMGDPPGMAPSHPESHGTPAQRIDAFRGGYFGGFR